jgi:hypothetical protein
VGVWYTDLWVTTNSPGSSKIRIPVMVEVEPTVSVNPGALDLGEIKVGATVEKSVVVRGGQPFKVTDLRGGDGSLEIKAAVADARPVHVIRVKFTPKDEGALTRSVKIVTDIKNEGEVELPIRATVVK